VSGKRYSQPIWVCAPWERNLRFLCCGYWFSSPLVVRWITIWAPLILDIYMWNSCGWDNYLKNLCRTLIFRANSLRQSVAKYVARVKTRKLLQICTQVVTRLLSSRYQDVFSLLVPSCCDKSGTSCYHLVTRLMTVTDLLQVVPTRPIQAIRKLVVNNLLRANDGRLAGTTCCEVTRW
jgi:hypothetical protein